MMPKRVTEPERYEMYKSQFEHWLMLSGQREWKNIVEFTSYFFSESRSKKTLGQPTIAKTIKQPPSRSDGAYNLLTILGVLYALGAIKTQQDIDTFLSEYQIELPKETTWEEIWAKIEQGAKTCRGELESSAGGQGNWANPDTLLPLAQTEAAQIPHDFSSKPKMKLPRRLVIAIMVAILIVFSTAIWFFTQPQRNLSPVYSVCSASESNAPTIFVPDQGFSVHQADSSAPSISILSNNVRSIGANPQGLWVGYIPDGTIQGVSFATPKNVNSVITNYWTHCGGLPLRLGQNINSFAFKDNSVYVAIDAGNDHPDDAGVARLTQTGWKLYRLQDRLPSNIIYNVAIDKNGTVWATTFAGVAKLVGDYWELV